jgi:glycosyltransferase involved in cell wall biosynthesis
VRVSVILTTYNQPEQLEKVLWAYASQVQRDFELVVADDGSAAETTQLIDRIAREARLNLLHVWHADRGFRKTEILNRAILAAAGEYLIFSDGDCIPRNDFVASHARLARKGSFLSGGYLKLPREVSSLISPADTRTGDVLRAEWLRAKGWNPGKRSIRLVRSPLVASVFDVLTTTRRTWNGHNSSAWKADIVAANGFDLDMGYGGLDRALGERFNNAGIDGIQVRHRIPCLHLWHERPYNTRQGWRRNHEIRERIRRNRETRANQGIAELAVDESVVTRRPGQLLTDTPPQQRAVL